MDRVVDSQLVECQRCAAVSRQCLTAPQSGAVTALSGQRTHSLQVVRMGSASL